MITFPYRTDHDLDTLLLHHVENVIIYLVGHTATFHPGSASDTRTNRFSANIAHSDQ